MMLALVSEYRWSGTLTIVAAAVVAAAVVALL